MSAPRIALVAFLVITASCSHPRPAPERHPPPPSYAPGSLAYAGSEACKPCHAAEYARWRTSRMANVVRDPKLHPEAILPDFSTPDPLLTFTAADVAFVYGSRWKQRYFQRVGDDYYPLPAQWDVTHKAWKPYHVPDTGDWWVPFYPKENSARPTGPLCDGCHSVNYDVATKTVTEWNVGCEKCHGPGADHVRAPTRANILDPATLDPVAATDVCIQCHSQGRPRTPPSPGRAYDWPVGYRVGLSLADFWQLEPHALGETTFTHYADGTAHKNRMQGNDFVQSLMYQQGVTCTSCHDPHGSDVPGILVAKATEVCAQCHAPGGPAGPRAPTLEAHTHHRAGSPGSECVACHMPAIAQTLGDVTVRSHTFRFVPPQVSEASKVPNACVACHADRTNAWAAAALRGWRSESPWRVAP